MSGLIALVGSGEYLPEMAAIERILLGHGTSYVQLPTAAALEGEARWQYWVELGRKQAERLGATAHLIPIRNRDDACDESLLEPVKTADLIYLSGGNPIHLGNTLRDTPALSAIVERWNEGASLAGCSAGAMVIGQTIVPFRRNHDAPGFGLVPGICVIPHFDRLSFGPISYRPKIPAGCLGVGIDELTALVGNYPEFQVMGKGRVSLWIDGKWLPFPAGSTLDLSRYS
jgi:cyanophycinase